MAWLRRRRTWRAARHPPARSSACERRFAAVEANGVDLDESALRLVRWLAIDAATERFGDDAAAERLATRDHRAGFVVPWEVWNRRRQG